jgi:hypothetical protein
MAGLSPHGTVAVFIAALGVTRAAAFAQVPPPCPSGGNCDNPAPCGSGCPDQDHDGLCDSWELAGGIDLNGDGVIDEENDVPLPGARPDRPDVYLQYDYMVLPGRGGHSHRPRPQSITAVVAAFARQGVALHAFPGHPLPHSAVLSSIPLDAACSGNDAVDFYGLKAQSFDPRKALAYHYVVFGHYNTCDSPVHCANCAPSGGRQVPFGVGGVAELPGNDFIVSLGYYVDLGFEPAVENEAAVFMHELGHNFGLRHAGEFDEPDYKPNYLSVMNNNFTYVGIPVADRPRSTTPMACRVAADCPPDAICAATTRTCTRIDYSRQALATIDEQSLDEALGIGAGSNDITAYVCPDYATGFGAGTGPVDWNCNGDTTDPSVSADLTGDARLGPLTGHRDWGSLAFDFQCVPSAADPHPTAGRRAPRGVKRWSR